MNKITFIWGLWGYFEILVPVFGGNYSGWVFLLMKNSGFSFFLFGLVCLKSHYAQKSTKLYITVDSKT